ncbi:serine hydrolase domain-containing protein [Ekhidna sp.]|uniref:serine hydrolase domain-containing protein n=1 Tax=Ekhidna sp. TaxID=2608089 RepID=UPI003C7E87EF
MKAIFNQLLAICMVIFVSCSTTTYSGRWVRWNASGIDDYKKFPSYDFQASENPFHFHVEYQKHLDRLMVPVDREEEGALLNVIKASETTAFIVIKNDTLLYEKYLSGYTRDSINTSFSVAKSFTSLLVGVAIDQGIIQSREDKISRYLPELLDVDPKYQEVQLSHLLDMKSGIQFKDHDLIWGDKPKAYYHPQLRERIMELPVTDEPGAEFKYNSYNPIVIGMILERVTGMMPAAYFEKQIWDQMGMEYGGSWSLDSEESRMTKMESGINLRAIDFAKFGRLVLKQGTWNSEQVISKEWMNQTVDISQQHVVDDYGGEIYYKDFWWLFSENGEQVDIISGWGHLGQYLYIFPETQVIIVRMGKDNDGVKSWSQLFKTINESLVE